MSRCVHCGQAAGEHRAIDDLCPSPTSHDDIDCMTATKEEWQAFLAECWSGSTHYQAGEDDEEGGA